MKQSKDENTIVLDDGVELKSTPANACGGCYFDKYPFETYCLNINCQASDREDRKNVIFIKAENEQKNR